MAIRISGNFTPNSFAGTAFSVISPAVPYSSIQPVVYSTASAGIDVVVPQEVGLLEVIAWGSAGQKRNTDSASTITGTGGTCVAYVAVTPGETLSFRVGDASNNGAGTAGSSSSALTSNRPGRGGGYTGVFREGIPLVIAGGGGGNANGEVGVNGGCTNTAQCGTQTAGGITCNASNFCTGHGSFLQGGSGQSGGTTARGGAGGGGGFYGGAGGAQSGLNGIAHRGGGGSNLCPTLPTVDIFPDQSGAWAPGKRLTQAGIHDTIPGYIAGRGITSNPGLLIVRWLPLTVDFGL